MKNLSVLGCLFLFCFKSSFSQPTKEMRPKLVVGLVIDQMRWDYLYRYYDRYSDKGFKRLLNEGFSYDNAFINYANSVTAAGHASLYTGATPSLHGIVGNEWIDRKTGLYNYCVSDKSVSPVGGSAKAGMMSPKNLLATTIGDELRIATNFRSRVFGIAVKDRGSILPAGRSAEDVYWFDDSTGNFISSSYYMKTLPHWAVSFNKRKIADSLILQKWNLLYPAETYIQSTPDNMDFEYLKDGEPIFPHIIDIKSKSRFAAFRYTPAVNTLAFEYAKNLLISENAGRMQTDMLCLSISGTDYIGHAYGPSSIEAEDAYLRLDRDIAEFLNFLDEQYGKENYLFFLSADHGAPQIPSFLKSKKINAGSNNNYALVSELNNELNLKFHHKNIIKAYFDFQFFVDENLIDSLSLPKHEIYSFIKNYLKNIPGVSDAFDHDSIYTLNYPVAIKEMFNNSYYRQRSGTIKIIMEPQFTDYKEKGTEHGTIYNYDTHIPLMFFGKNIPAGSSSKRVFITDLAPTICSLLKIQVPNASFGKVLQFEK